MRDEISSNWNEYGEMERKSLHRSPKSRLSFPEIENARYIGPSLCLVGRVHASSANLYVEVAKSFNSTLSKNLITSSDLDSSAVNVHYRVSRSVYLTFPHNS